MKTSISISDATKKQLASLKALTGMRMGTIITTAVDRYYREERMMAHWSDVFGNGMTAEQIIEQIERETPGNGPLMKEWINTWLRRQYDELVADNPGSGYEAGRYSDADFVRFTNQIVRESGCEAI